MSDDAECDREAAVQVSIALMTPIEFDVTFLAPTVSPAAWASFKAEMEKALKGMKDARRIPMVYLDPGE